MYVLGQEVQPYEDVLLPCLRQKEEWEIQRALGDAILGLDLADRALRQYLPSELMLRFPTTRQNEYRWDAILFLKVVDGASDASLIVTLAHAMLQRDLSVYPMNVSKGYV